MRLLDELRLTESEILAPPIVGTLEHLIDRVHGQQFMSSAILEKL